jgi:chlorite dismutase
MEKRILTNYAMFSLNENFWKLPVDERKSRLRGFFKDTEEASEKTWFYQVYPSQTKYDIMVWTNIDATELEAPNKYMENFAKATNKYREFLTPVLNFWGMTKPSIYSKAKRSEQELDPFEETRLPYFIIYPFSKTPDWYLKSREERQNMMNDHIRIGKTFREITQLLLYSFGLQDQEFIVAYETEDLSKWSDLVYELRMTQARIYTLNDTPIITGMFRQADEMVKIFSGK